MLDSQRELALVVGDSVFPLSTYLMKQTSRDILNEKQKYFNYRFSRSKMVTESPFGQMKKPMEDPVEEM